MTQSDSAPHVPVLRDEVIAALAPQPTETHVDGTFGAGGYSRALLAAGARVVGIDRDPDAVATGRELEAENADFTMIAGLFSDLASQLAERDIDQVDGVTFDIGVSSMQFDQGTRGFSFQADGPLDMRMSQAGMTAAEWLNSADEADIADVIYRYGEERRSRRIAHAIVAARPLTTTGELARIVRKAVGHKPHDKKDPATRAFQAIRIFINAELEELERGLAAAERVLRPGGRLAVVSFHSLEDRIVKRFLKRRSGALGAGSRHHPPTHPDAPAPTFSSLAKAVRASDAEIARNPRARSATLRAGIRSAAPAWDETFDRESAAC
ncbi:16S rRNA (cytosine(1402)-N(4))-methyltransferase RsmH [Sphingorhabdus soli]|uniref:Ribosomal RNA small subunit methyltransferase H n=1 Tax=Flavisphingopyxis soli TaxID=2601267 RepID=A0A5C6U7E5_9SPHN|nr:16S rRNA (cytosine(1402)-N(4))-methyltransferase RsmH [Sphingorhabdus soli]TXC68724.1 16S rRNA (cytosine(1402)-N(4))-methyltransferase RsmH [Sphingorhabdus soli]